MDNRKNVFAIGLFISSILIFFSVCLANKNNVTIIQDTPSLGEEINNNLDNEFDAIQSKKVVTFNKKRSCSFGSESPSNIRLCELTNDCFTILEPPGKGEDIDTSKPFPERYPDYNPSY